MHHHLIDADSHAGLDILVVVVARACPWNFDNLAAPYWRLYWNPRSGAHVRYGKAHVGLEPDRLLLIPPETDFAARAPRPIDHFFVHFRARPPYDAAPPGIYSLALDASDRRLLRAVLAEAGEEDFLEGEAGRGSRRDGAEAPGGDGSQERTAPPLAGRAGPLALALAAGALARLPTDLFGQPENDPHIRAALAAMDRRLDAPLSNAELAAAAGMGRNAFLRRFRERTGRTPQDLYTDKRIARACVLLQFSAMSVEQVAAATGFCDRYHLSRVFRRRRGLGPAAFRRAVV
jgi:AraC-like DNA-binding protein